MIVLDASAAVDFLVGENRSIEDRIARSDVLIVPSHFEAEVLNALRSMERGGVIDHTAMFAAAADLRLLRLLIHEFDEAITERVLALRHNLNVYDAAYAALAEAYEMPLITTDAKAGRYGRHLRCTIEVI